MYENLQWLFYIWTITSKYIKTYEKSDKSEWQNFNLKFEFMGWYEIIRTTKNVFETLEENKTYILPVGTSTKKELDFVNIFIKSKSEKIYEIDSDWLTEIHIVND